MTYIETVLRYVVEYNETMTQERQEAYEAEGVDPRHLWTLKYSFTSENAAVTQANREQDNHDKFCIHAGYKPWKTFRVRDLGSLQKIERSF